MNHFQSSPLEDKTFGPSFWHFGKFVWGPGEEGGLEPLVSKAEAEAVPEVASDTHPRKSLIIQLLSFCTPGSSDRAQNNLVQWEMSLLIALSDL